MISAPLVLIIVAIEAGITDVYTLSSMFALMACCQVLSSSLCGFAMALPLAHTVTHALDPRFS